MKTKHTRKIVKRRKDGIRQTYWVKDKKDKNWCINAKRLKMKYHIKNDSEPYYGFDRTFDENQKAYKLCTKNNIKQFAKWFLNRLPQHKNREIDVLDFEIKKGKVCVDEYGEVYSVGLA